jgi:hypothetical protein
MNPLGTIPSHERCLASDSVRQTRSRALASTIWIAVALAWPAPAGALQAAMERIVVAPDGKGFITVPSQHSFVPWGVNYGNAGRLLEDFWDKDWETLAGDFHELEKTGANVIRVHLQWTRVASINGAVAKNHITISLIRRSSPTLAAVLQSA